jgi:hypothetical protein
MNGLELERFISIAFQGVRQAELLFDRDEWAKASFASVDSNHDNFITSDEFSTAFLHTTIRNLFLHEGGCDH